MSWDIFISKTPVDQLDEAIFEPLGNNSEVMESILEIIPTTKFDATGWGVYRNEECSIEINIGETDIIDHIMLYIRGGGDSPILIIQDICKNFNCFAMDGSTGEQMTFDNIDQESFLKWQGYRNIILDNIKPDTQ